MTQRALDLFAGPGGWDVHDAELGLATDRVENDDAARATAEAFGLRHVGVDVTTYNLPADQPYTGGKFSPPCQTFSNAGNGHGRKALDIVHKQLLELVETGEIDYSHFTDVRTGLVLEPLRIVLQAFRLGQPLRWLALEQVPAVLPVWQQYADVLTELGYSVATGNVHAEQYGVPQTRKRAVLLASLDRDVSLPAPTHSKYHTQTPERLDEGVLPWVSMATALGHSDFVQEAQTGMGALARQGRTARPVRRADQPSFTITANGKDHTGKQGGCARLRMISNYGSNGDPSNRGVRTVDQPAPTVTSKINRNKWQPADRGVRVSVADAAAFQTFPPDYPWQGVKTAQYQQVGNAIPPLLAKVLLQQVI